MVLYQPRGSACGGRGTFHVDKDERWNAPGVGGAIGIFCGTKLLICDEPPRTLDVMIQAQYLQLLWKVQKETGVALISIKHDMGIVARMCNRVMVMYAGRTVESGTVCHEMYPAMEKVSEGHHAACHFPGDWRDDN